MGVRFQCPAGHKLHVKAELAGRRGICPECGAKFVVPSFSGGRVAEDNGDAASPAASATSTPPPVARTATGTGAAADASSVGMPTESVIIPTQPGPAAPPSQPALTPAAPPAAAPTSAAPIAWYVRPASGGQFGPATAEVFQEWIADGRVAIDSWVWRTGWTDWKPGGEALALIAADGPAAAPARELAVAIEERAGVLPGAISTTAGTAAAKPHVELGTAELRRLEIKRRKQRVRMISTALALVALAMLMALVVVLAR